MEHHHHHPVPQGLSRALALGIALNLGFIALEVSYGLAAHSLALLADAGHNTGDVLGLLLAWGALCMARLRARGRFTYGLQSASIIAALLNALLLFGALAGIGWEALHRLQAPEAVATGTVLWVAIAGVAVNAATALLLHRNSHDLNIKAAFIHMLADAAISLGVALSALATEFSGVLWLDPATSLVIVGIIAWGTWGLFREAISLAMHAAPSHIDLSEVKAFLSSMDGVNEVHDLHIWAISTTEIALSAHLVMPAGHPGDTFLHQVSCKLMERFRIGHATLQIEMGTLRGMAHHHDCGHHHH